MGWPHPPGAMRHGPDTVGCSPVSGPSSFTLVAKGLRMMARALLGDDPGCCGGERWPILLDDDCGHTAPCGCLDGGGDGDDDTDDWPHYEVRLRQRTGYTDEGVALYAWEAAMTAAATDKQERTEHDPRTGTTVVTAALTIGNPAGLALIPETSVLVNVADPEEVWQVTGSKAYAGRHDLQVRRIWREK